MKDLKKAIKDCGLVLLTGGLYMVVIFIRVLFTTTEGQKLIEQEFKDKIKAFRIEEEEKNQEPKDKKED